MGKFLIIGLCIFYTCLFYFTCNYSKKLNEGVIDKKYFQPPHWENYSNVVVVGKITTTVPGRRYIDDTAFYVHFFKISKKDTLKRQVEVSSQVYHSHKIGDYIVLKKQ